VTLGKMDVYFGSLSKAGHLMVATVLLGAMGAIDMLTGAEISWSVFYLLPIVQVTWYAGFGLGSLTALAAALVWLAADRYDSLPYSHALIPYWNMAVRLAFFLLVAYLLARLQQELRREEALARTDSLTGLNNTRGFRLDSEYELQRSGRYNHPFTAAYIDLDNFKAVNDNFGHLEGDLVLKEVARSLKEALRRPDSAARLGGDEFAVLLPETDAEGARVILARLRTTLNSAMQQRAWPVTFSIGAVSFSQPPESVDEILRSADRLMYHVKSSGKNDIAVAVHNGNSATTAGPAARRRW
jgi:diguanylate cyclase (GGDEF)-like protein